MEQKMPIERKRYLIIMIMATIALTVVLAYLDGLMLDEVVIYLTMDAIFLSVFIYILESNRLQGAIGSNKSSHYKSISNCYIFSCVLVCIGYFIPAFTMPAVALALFMSIAANPEIAVSVGIFLSVLLCIATKAPFYELASYCILVLVGAQIAKTMHEKSFRIWGCLILISISICVPMLFYYLTYSQASLEVLEWNLVVNLMVVMIYMMLASRMYDQADYTELHAIEEIIKEDYSLFQDIKKCSMAEYVHAMKVSTVARKCAKEIGANDKTVAAAGFYYRLGILEGEPFVENGVKLAEEKGFPESVVKILWEYNGEKQLPSTKESAIVHMVDACLKKIEMLTGHNLSTSWNQDMVIYQVLNELSASGIYDESGLSMNQFLKVRELLVREEIGYDN